MKSQEQKPTVKMGIELKSFLDSQTKNKESYEETLIRLLGLQKEDNQTNTMEV